MDSFDSGRPSQEAALTHPWAVSFFLFFRVAALASYLFCYFISKSFVLNFIIIVLLLAFDFWNVKNISGRFLVGLRWWNQVNEDGSSQWRFESKQNFVPHPRESKIFWWSLYLFPVAWLLLAMTALMRLSFSYMIIVVVGVTLNVSNVIGYHKCSKEAGKKADPIAQLAGATGQDFFARAATNIASSAMQGGANAGFTSDFFGSSSPKPTP